MLNGRSVPDPADGGTLPRRSMAVGQWDAGWSKGYYGHLTAQATYSTWRGDANAWDGNEFWLQYWTKFPSNRWNLGLPHGKHVMMLAYPADRYSQELVVQSLGNTAGGNWPESVSAPRRRFEMYTGYGSWWGTLSDPQGNVGGQAAIQPGYNAPTCYYSPSSTPNYAGCWEYPAEEWVNLLIHVKPSPNIPGGINSYPSIVAMPSQYRTFQIEVWGVRQSQLASGYTKIYSKADYAWSYGDESNPNGIASYAGQQFHPPAFNSFLFNAYMNGRPSTEAFYHRYAQIIFSRRPISPPQA